MASTDPLKDELEKNCDKLYFKIGFGDIKTEDKFRLFGVLMEIFNNIKAVDGNIDEVTFDRLRKRTTELKTEINKLKPASTDPLKDMLKANCASLYNSLLLDTDIDPEVKTSLYNELRSILVEINSVGGNFNALRERTKNLKNKIEELQGANIVTPE